MVFVPGLISLNTKTPPGGRQTVCISSRKSSTTNTKNLQTKKTAETYKKKEAKSFYFIVIAISQESLHTGILFLLYHRWYQGASGFLLRGGGLRHFLYRGHVTGGKIVLHLRDDAPCKSDLTQYHRWQS